MSDIKMCGHGLLADCCVDCLRARVAELERERDGLRERVSELEHEVERREGRERHFAKVLSVADGGAYRNDWDAAIESVVKARDAAESRASAAVEAHSALLSRIAADGTLDAMERASAAEQRAIQLACALDSADCTQREGGDARHCRIESPCWRCRAEAAEQRVRKLERERKFYLSWEIGETALQKFADRAEAVFDECESNDPKAKRLRDWLGDAIDNFKQALRQRDEAKQRASAAEQRVAELEAKLAMAIAVDDETADLRKAAESRAKRLEGALQAIVKTAHDESETRWQDGDDFVEISVAFANIEIAARAVLDASDCRCGHAEAEVPAREGSNA